MANSGSYTDPLQNRNPVSQAKDTAKQQVQSLLGDQQHAAATGLGDFAQALRKVAREMGDGKQGNTSRLVEGAAERLERFSGSLKEKDLDGIVRDVESFARRQPVAFFGAAVAAGFLAMRFLKSTNQPTPKDFRSDLPRDYTSGAPF
jgi:hypothetical protein